MKRCIAALALLPLAACASSAPPPEPIVERGGKPYQFTASPGDVVAAEIAFGRLIQDEGLWNATRKTADKSAESFRPRRVLVSDWLMGIPRGLPSNSKREVSSVFMSCDGRFAATTGLTTQTNAEPKAFTTIWAKNLRGQWMWVLSHDFTPSAKRMGLDTVETRIASCEGKPSVPLTAPNVGEDMKVGLSRDQSLRFVSTVRPDDSRRIEVSLWNGKSFDSVIMDEVPAGQ